MHNIRPIAATDNSSLASIIRSAFEEFDAPKTGTVYSDPTTDQLYDLFTNAKNAFCFVAEDQGEVLGCCGVYPTIGLPNGYGELVKFYLAAKARGKGIGKALFERCIAEAKQQNYEYLYIESQASFNKALGMYKKYGFHYIDHPLGHSGHDSCDLWMVKNLLDSN